MLRATQAQRFFRVMRGTPEVMVKVTGSNRDAAGLKAHLLYLFNDKKAEHVEDETEAVLLQPKEDIGRLTREWRLSETLNEDRPSPLRRRTAAVHIVLSMPRGTPPDAVLASARGFAAEELSNHRYMLVLHKDQDHPHVHAVVNNVGYDWSSLKRSRLDLQRWRETFARELRSFGVEAEATPRKTRGVIRQPELKQMRARRDRVRHQQAVGHLRQIESPHTFQIKVRQAAEELRAREASEHVAAGKARENRRVLELVLADAVATLQTQGADGRRAAMHVQRFISKLPVAETEFVCIKRGLLDLWSAPQISTETLTRTDKQERGVSR